VAVAVVTRMSHPVLLRVRSVEKLTEDTDDLLDEIDDVLEENAEDFVRAYVQKGGQ
jgi:ubiquitin-like protein Pup